MKSYFVLKKGRVKMLRASRDGREMDSSIAISVEQRHSFLMRNAKLSERKIIIEVICLRHVIENQAILPLFEKENIRFKLDVRYRALYVFVLRCGIPSTETSQRPIE